MKTILKGLFTLSFLLSVVGCAGTQKKAVDQSILPTLKGKSIVQVQRESPTFVAMTSGKGMFALAGVAAAAAEGNQLVKNNQIKDPALSIGESVSAALVANYGLVDKGQSDAVLDTNDIAQIATQAEDSDYALDVATNGWSFIYDGFRFSEYIVGCSVKLRMIDVQKAKPIAEGICAYDTKTAGKPNVSYETLLENDAAYIKQTLADASKFCSEKFLTELF